MSSSAPTPITILTGFLGSGKTTLLLKLLPQLPANYGLALLKNEFGDVAVDSRLASQGSISGVKELLNGCICCNLVGQLGSALVTLKTDYKPNRIVVETSGSAFPATLAMEVNRVISDYPNSFVLDGVILVIDVENWTGYADTSYTAKVQARYTDLIILNKWESVTERREDEVVDRIRDVNEDTPVVKSDKGWVSKNVIFGVDSGLAKELSAATIAQNHEHDEGGGEEHTQEVDVISITLPYRAEEGGKWIDLEALYRFLTSAPKDEVYRIKGSIFSLTKPKSDPPLTKDAHRFILNWAFGRWTFTALPKSSVSTIIEAPALRPTTSSSAGSTAPPSPSEENQRIEVIVQTSIKTTVEQRDQNDIGQEWDGEPVGRFVVITARGEGERWRKRIEKEPWIKFDSKISETGLEVVQIT
ncbi:cobW-domain-containing protein [Tuber magnatum]|uniref:CobW-domain-containing protein n=1 Tax=Tuber magnatum TaxID=42249 RepID=A0A317SPH1_9PEZI|nr:cobW-domain-containing protein [Tuber magnatum]